MFLIVTVQTQTDNKLDILMSKEYFDNVKDWMFSSCDLRLIETRPASEAGVTVK